MKYAQKHFESTFGSAYFKPNKTELKLAKTVKMEPRKASFSWELGLLLGKPMRYALISGFNLFIEHREIYSEVLGMKSWFHGDACQH